jgi:hypothetical protein
MCEFVCAFGTVCVCVCVYIYVYIYIYICTHTHTQMHRYMEICRCDAYMQTCARGSVLLFLPQESQRGCAPKNNYTPNPKS